MNSILHNTHLDEFVSAAVMQNKTHDVIRAPAAELLVVEPNSIATIQKMKYKIITKCYMKCIIILYCNLGPMNLLLSILEYQGSLLGIIK